MRQSIIIALLITSIWSCAQKKSVIPSLVGGPCEGCEAVLEYSNPLNDVDTLPGFAESGPKMKIEGTVYQLDGKTPAKDVIIYLYHTNQQGYYEAKKDAQGWGKRHGCIRSWVKTNEKGHYTYYTLKPAPYPNRIDPTHIHYTILEPDGKYYYISSVEFRDDPRLKNTAQNPAKARGGNGIIELVNSGGLLIGTRDIVLGKNVPGYEK